MIIMCKHYDYAPQTAGVQFHVLGIIARLQKHAISIERAERILPTANRLDVTFSICRVAYMAQSHAGWHTWRQVMRVAYMAPSHAGWPTWRQAMSVAYMAPGLARWPTLHQAMQGYLHCAMSCIVTYMAPSHAGWPALHQAMQGDLHWAKSCRVT